MAFPAQRTRFSPTLPPLPPWKEPAIFADPGDFMDGHGSAKDGHGDAIDGNGSSKEGNEDSIDGNGIPKDGNGDLIDGNGAFIYGNGSSKDGNGNSIDGNESGTGTRGIPAGADTAGIIGVANSFLASDSWLPPPSPPLPTPANPFPLTPHAFVTTEDTEDPETENWMALCA